MYPIILGLDEYRHFESALHLLARLHPTDSVVHAVHAVETPPLFLGSLPLPTTTEALSQVLEEEVDCGRRLATEVQHRLPALGLGAGATEIAFDHPARALIEDADRRNARLIAVGNRGQGAVRAFFTGSVARALVIGAHQSVLIAKGEPAPTGPMRAVFATDHSPYADQCLAELLAMAPQGLSHLTVLTCYPRDLVQAVRPLVPEFILDPAEWIEQNLRERNARVVEALAPLARNSGCAIDSRVFADSAQFGIGAVMQETAADLLILGAQGHGFYDRLTLGSTSFHYVVAEPYSTLVLRVSSLQSLS